MTEKKNAKEKIEEKNLKEKRKLEIQKLKEGMRADPMVLSKMDKKENKKKNE